MSVGGKRFLMTRDVEFSLEESFALLLFGYKRDAQYQVHSKTVCQ